MLCGETLPNLYEKFSGKRFVVAKDKTGERAQDKGGVAFVIAAHQLMGLGKLSPETIKSHWLASNRVKRSSK